MEAKSLAGSQLRACLAQHSAPPTTGTGFAANLRDVVRLSRQEAPISAPRPGAVPTLRRPAGCFRTGHDQRAPGRACSPICKPWLPALLGQAVVRSRRSGRSSPPQGPFPTADPARAQGLRRRPCSILGFDFDGGRLDVSAHPFCGGVPQDVRITTRYDEDDLLSALFGVIHETGHARYEQNLPRAVGQDQPVATRPLHRHPRVAEPVF